MKRWGGGKHFYHIWLNESRNVKYRLPPRILCYYKIKDITEQKHMCYGVCIRDKVVGGLE